MKTQSLKLKRFLAFSFVVATTFLIGFQGVFAQASNAREFLVTAYYSPLPDQSFYIRGSYEADMRLNGRGTNGADGTEVYMGMLAAPSSYAFGTRLNIPGLGVGEVHDRGGAILEGENYDRIDVWMGHGEEGLARALNWGSRLLEGEIYPDGTAVLQDLDFSWVSSHLSPGFIEQLQGQMPPEDSESVMSEEENIDNEPLLSPPIPNNSDIAVSAQTLHSNELDIERLQASQLRLEPGLFLGDEGDSVLHLQKILWELDYFKGPLTGVYDSITESAILEFQLDRGVIATAQSPGAGRFGPKTLEVLSMASNHYIDRLEDHSVPVQVWVPASNDMPSLAELTAPEAAERKELVFVSPSISEVTLQPSYLVFDQALDLEDRGDSVIALQTLLIEEGYLAPGLSTGYYGEKTEEAVLELQVVHGIVSSELALGAGRVGPKTLEVLNHLS